MPGIDDGDNALDAFAAWLAQNEQARGGEPVEPIEFEELCAAIPISRPN